MRRVLEIVVVVAAVGLAALLWRSRPARRGAAAVSHGDPIPFGSAAPQPAVTGLAPIKVRLAPRASREAAPPPPPTTAGD